MQEPTYEAPGQQPEPNDAARSDAGAEAPAAEPAPLPGGGDAAEPAPAEPESAALTAEELLGAAEQPAGSEQAERTRLKAILEALVYVLSEPMPAAQIAQALGRPLEEVEPLLRELAADTSRPDRGVFIREVAGGYQMATKPEHHEVIRIFVRNLKQPLKLSQAALETLAVIAYKQPITLPEILEIRGVQGAGVIKTLIERKLVTAAGRKNVVGRPILYKTTRDFLTQFGLKDLSELPSLKEFEEIRRQSIADEEFEPPPGGAEQPSEAAPAGGAERSAEPPEVRPGAESAAEPDASSPAEETPASEERNG